MKLTRVIAAAALSIVSISGLAAFAGPASASSRPPVIYNAVVGWSHPQVKPAYIYIGEGGSPIARTRHWNTWSSKVARSTGTLITDNCIPNCAKGTAGYHKLYVTLSGVKYHNGRAYYSVMTWYTPGYWLYGEHSSTVMLRFGPQSPY